MGSKKSPAPPDYTQAAIQTGQSSRENTEAQTWANRPNQYTPEGSSTWSNSPTYDPTTGKNFNQWTQNIDLSPEGKKAYDAQARIKTGRSDIAESLLGNAQNDFANPVDWGSFSKKGSALTPNQYNAEQIQRGLDFGGATSVNKSDVSRNRAEAAMYERGASHLDPRFAREEDATRTRLANQGYQEGDAGYDEEMRKFNERKDQQYQDLSRESILAGGQESSRDFGMDLSKRQQDIGEIGQQGSFANTAAQQALSQQLGIGGRQFGEQEASSNMDSKLRQQDISEELQKRGWSINEINAIIGGQQIGMPGMPGFNSATKSDTVDYSGAARDQWGASLDQSSNEQAQKQALYSGIGSAAMMFSDERLKKNIVRIGTLACGLPLYAFEYLWGVKGIGVMAHECVRILPEAVHEHSSGYLMVDYGVFQ